MRKSSLDRLSNKENNQTQGFKRARKKNITHFELLLGAESIWLYCAVMKLIWSWETVIYYSYQSLWAVLQSTCRIWKKKDANNILMWYSVFNLLYAAEYYSWAKNDQKVRSLLYKETEEDNLNFKLSHLSLSIDWVLLIKINSKPDYHFYLLSSPECMLPSCLDFFLSFIFPFTFFFYIGSCQEGMRHSIPWCLPSCFSSSGNIWTCHATPDVCLQICPSQVGHPPPFSLSHATLRQEGYVGGA